MQGLTEGSRLADRYVLLRRLGGGGMSDVWSARDERADTVVALKFLKPVFAKNAAYRKLFHDEWRMGSRLMHAHIVRVFEYHDSPDSPFFALQFIDGPDLGVLANEPLENALRPFGLLADALRYAHSKSYVHRDIKASNVLLDAGGAPYLIDFGVATAPGAGHAGGGTPGAESTNTDAGPPDDIYALGVLLHETISGRPPAAEPMESLARPNGERVPGAIVALLADMLDTDPVRRPDADTVAARLAAAGFAAGPARLSNVASAVADVTPVDVPLRRVSPKPAATVNTQPTQAADGGGLSARAVYAALAVLLFVAAGVVFLLPDVVNKPTNESAAVADAPDASVDASTAGDAAAGPDDAGETDTALGSQLTDAEIKRATDEALGDLLTQVARLRERGIERWGGQPYLDAMDVYAAGDEAYVGKNYLAAGDRYRETADMLAPFFGQIDAEFEKTLAAAKAAFAREDAVEAIRLFDLAAAITPGNTEAERGLRRARSLGAVLDLMEQGAAYRDEQALEAARLAFEKALELDADWQPARDALAGIEIEISEYSFQARMSEGLAALGSGDFATARAAFNAAKSIDPSSPEPRDGLLQVDQEIRLQRIAGMEAEAAIQEDNEQWESAVATYEALLEVDADLQFAQQGLARAKARSHVHRQLKAYMDDPDSLSDPATMQRATQLLLSASRLEPQGPRLTDDKDELSRLLKRAATPLIVSFVSDNETEVSIYRVGKLGRFASRNLELRPGQYVATGIRSGYRDVRLEFRVAPELDMGTIVIQCEEPI